MRDVRPNPLAWMMPLSAVALAAGILLGRASDTVWYGAAALAFALLAAWCARGRERRAAFLLAVASVGFLRGYAAYHPALPEEGTYTVTGVVADEVRVQENGQVRTLLQEVTLNGRRLWSGAYWTGYPDELPEGLAPGASVAVTARVYHPNGEDNPGGFNLREYLLQRGVTIGLYGMDDVSAADGRFSLAGWTARVRHTLSEKLVQAMGEEAGGYAAAILLGNRWLIPSEDRAAFNQVGIAHILSVSGYHVGVLAFMLAGLFRLTRMPWKLRTVITAVVLAAYCLLTGMNAPVVRASMLLMLYQLGRLQHRQNIGMHLLSASAVLMLLIAPAQLTGPSFQLSYGAMLGLVLILPLLERLRLFRKSRFRGLWNALCAAFAAQVGILMPQLYWFQELPLLALPINVLVMTVAALLIALYWLELALLILPSAAAAFGVPLAIVTARLLDAIRWLGGMEGIVLWTKQANAATFLGWAAVLAALSSLWTKRRRWPVLLGVAVMALSLVVWPFMGVRYIQFSVGNADAALLRDHDVVVAVDVGEDGEAMATYLKQRRLSVDMLILTHLHSDHAGGIRALLDNGIPVRSVCLAEGALNAAIDGDMPLLLDELLDTGAELQVLARGDVIDLPSGSMTALWPERGKVRAGMDANAHSLVMRLDLLGTTMLLTGDLDGDYEQYAALPADILKVAHHGSKGSTSEAYLAAVSPQTLLLSCGDETRQASMEERGGDIPLYGTREHGAITFDFTDGGYAISTMR